MRVKNGLLIMVFLIALIVTGCSGGGGGGGTTPGGTAIDTTAPSVPVGLTAAAGSSSSITLNWIASTDSVGVTGYKIYRNGTQITTSANNTYSDSGLTASTTYTYTVCAYDAAGNNSAQSASASGTTMATGQSDTQAPTVPTNLTATAASTSQINLSWTASTDNVGVSGYEIWRGSTKITTVTNTTYNDTGLTASTSYTYTVKAYDGANNISAASNSATATTLSAGGGSGVGSIRVRVLDGDDIRLPSATVILGNSDGSMVSYGVTDSNGEYTFSSPPANATVSMVTGRGCNDGRYTMAIIYDINVSAITLRQGSSCSNTSVQSTTVKVINIPSNATRINLISGGSNWGIGAPVNNQASTSISIKSDDLQSDGKASLAAVAYDANDNPVSYGVLLDQSVSSSMTLTISADQSFTNAVQYQLTNIPTTATSFENTVNHSRKAQAIYTRKSGLLTGTTTTTFSMPYIPGFSDSFAYQSRVYLDRNGNNKTDAFLFMDVLGGAATVPSNQSFDFSQALPAPSNIAVSYATGTATPTLFWTGSSTGSFATYAYLGTTSTSTACILDAQVYAAPTRTSIIFPQLPDSLAICRPASVSSLMAG